MVSCCGSQMVMVSRFVAAVPRAIVPVALRAGPMIPQGYALV